MIKLLKENIGKIINAHALGKALLDIKPKDWSLKNNDKITKVNVCSEKNDINGIKRQATDWEKTFPNHISNEIFVSKMSNELSK